MRTTPTRRVAWPVRSAAALPLAMALGALARPDVAAQQQPPPPPSARAKRRSISPGYWVVGRQRRLAPPDGDAAQGRLREPAGQRRGAPRGRRVGSRRGQRGRPAVQGVRRRRHHAPARTPAHHVGGRRHAASRVRRRHADAAARVRRDGAPGRREDVAGVFARASGRAASVGRAVAAGRLSARQIGSSARGRSRRAAAGAAARRSAAVGRRSTQGGSLKVVTTNFRDGLSAQERRAVQRECRRSPSTSIGCPTQPNGDEWLHVVTIVEDPTYLSEPFYTSTMFKREPNGREVESDAVPHGAAARSGVACREPYRRPSARRWDVRCRTSGRRARHRGPRGRRVR